MRPDKDRYFLNIALEVSKRSTCLRRKYGVVIVKDDRIVGTGYNGPARGVVNCHTVGCTKDILQQPHYGSYDYCTAVHAEENAIINSDRGDRKDATLYIAGYIGNGPDLSEAIPCRRCQRKIINSLISTVVILTEDDETLVINPEQWVDEDTNWYLDTLHKAKMGDI